MESAGTIGVTPIIVALISSHGVMALAMIAIAFRIGRLPTREEHNELRGEVSDIKQEIANTKAELKQEIADAKTEMRQEITDAKTEMRQEIAGAKDEILQEIRRSNRQLMLALLNHTHRDDGQVIFTVPPELDLEPAPADD